MTDATDIMKDGRDALRLGMRRIDRELRRALDAMVRKYRSARVIRRAAARRRRSR